MPSFVFKGKMVVVGDIAVGKTSLATRFTNDQFTRNHIASVGGISLNVYLMGSFILFQNIRGG